MLIVAALSSTLRKNIRALSYPSPLVYCVWDCLDVKFVSIACSFVLWDEAGRLLFQAGEFMLASFIGVYSSYNTGVGRQSARAMKMRECIAHA